jgi:hypothetical protein
MSEQVVAGGGVESAPAFKAVVVEADVTLYECQQCGALVTKDGQEKHRNSHSEFITIVSKPYNERIRYLKIPSP